MANPSQVLLLADHIKLSLLERQRAIALGLDSSTQEGTISRSLESMREGVEAVEKEARGTGNDSTTIRDQASTLRKQYSELYSQFTGTPSAAPASLTSPNDPTLSSDFAAAQRIPPKATSQTQQSSLRRGADTSSPSPTPKSVRFRDNPSSDVTADDVEHEANRAALFPYRDNPSEDSALNQDDLSNTQIHAYHAQVIREQDEHLDRLGESIGRQRDLSIRIGDELEEQIAMLDDVEGHVDRHQGRLDGARERVGRIARKANDNKQITTIVVLIVILVLLIVVLK